MASGNMKDVRTIPHSAVGEAEKDGEVVHYQDAGEMNHVVMERMGPHVGKKERCVEPISLRFHG